MSIYEAEKALFAEMRTLIRETLDKEWMAEGATKEELETGRQLGSLFASKVAQGQTVAEVEAAWDGKSAQEILGETPSSSLVQTGLFWQNLREAAQSTELLLREMARNSLVSIETALKAWQEPEWFATFGGRDERPLWDMGGEVFTVNWIPTGKVILCRVVEPPCIEGERETRFRFLLSTLSEACDDHIAYCTVHLKECVPLTFEGKVSLQEGGVRLVEFDESPAPAVAVDIPLESIRLSFIPNWWRDA